MKEYVAFVRKRARPATAGPGLVALLLFVCVAACSDSRQPVDWGTLPSEQRVFSDSNAFLEAYWLRPIPLQGRAPVGFSELETSLEPSVCGTCHAPQYADWQTTVHAGAYSPGLSGQLVNAEAYNYQYVRSCLACHTPLSEQLAQVPDTSGALVSNPAFDVSLRGQGLVCASCHMRGWQRYGPPRRDGSLDPSPDGSPHGGVTRTPYFEDSRFCAGCHQFDSPAINGKSLQNTQKEWAESRYAAAGISCQSCHMPDRRHVWRGVHDSTMVQSGVTIDWVSQDQGAGAGEIELRITNSGTGHRFPTYVTPEIIARVELIDADGRVIEQKTVEATISRRVEPREGSWVELWDTRLSPDASLTLRAAVGDSARSARGTVVVRPDAFYEGVFNAMRLQQLSDTSRVLIGEAHRRASSSFFTIFDDTLRIR